MGRPATNSSTPANADDDTKPTTSAGRRSRERKLWFRNLSPVRTRSSTGSLPKVSPRMGNATPTKPRKPRVMPATTSPVRRSNPPRKCKSASLDSARRSPAQRDKQVEGNVVASGDGQADEVDGNGGESDSEDEVKTPGVSDDGAWSPGGYYDDDQDTDTNAHAKPDEFAYRGGVKTPGVSDNEAPSPPGGYYDDWDTGAHAKPDKSASRDRVKTPGISDNEALSPDGYYDDRDTSAAHAKPDEFAPPAPRDGVETPVVSDKGTGSVAQEVGRSGQAPGVANPNAPLGAETAMIIPTGQTPTDFIVNVEAFKFHISYKSEVTCLFIYFPAPICKILLVGTISPRDTVPSLPTNWDEGIEPGSADPDCVWYKFDRLWYLAEGIPLKKLQEAYGFKGPLTEPIRVSPKTLAMHPLGGLQRVV